LCPRFHRTPPGAQSETGCPTLAPGRPGYPDDAFSVLAASRFVNIISYAEIGKQEIVPNLGLTHNLGGFPHQNVCSVSIVGQYEA
jgi:hypothetical protein